MPWSNALGSIRIRKDRFFVVKNIVAANGKFYDEEIRERNSSGDVAFIQDFGLHMICKVV